MVAYETSKFGLVGFTRALRTEYCRSGLGISCLCPGFVRTNIFESARQNNPKQKIAAPPALLFTDAERVADAAIKAIRRNRPMVIVPFTVRVCVWLDHAMPNLIDLLLRNPWRNKKRAKRRAALPGANRPGTIV